MIHLAPVEFGRISSWFVDFQKRSKCFEMPPEQAELLGIYRGEELIGYFILVTYTNNILEINQGYLKSEARHKNLSRISMELLEKKAKKVGIKKIVLGTNRAVGSYVQFMRSMGYGLERAIFSKAVQ